MEKLGIILFLSTMLFSIQISAIDQDYTYVSDYQFLTVDDVLGYTFYPSKLTTGAKNKRVFSPGEAALVIVNEKVYIKGISELKVLKLISGGKSETGYNFFLCDNKDYSELTHLKIVVDDKWYAHKIYIYSDRFGEFTFTLPLKSKTQVSNERQYYTPKNKISVNHIDDLKNLFLVPYYKSENRNYHQKKKVKPDNKFSIKIKKQNIVFNSKKRVRNYTIKKVVGSNTQFKEQPLVNRVYEFQLKNERSKSLKIYINRYNLIEVIEFGSDLYFLLP